MHSTHTDPVLTDVIPGSDADPFRYGWRYVRMQQPDGTEVVHEVPLRLIDLLHPEEGDHVTHTEAHERRCVYLYNIFQAQVHDDPTTVVLHDVRIAWDVPDLRPHGPDLMVIPHVRVPQNWSTFEVADEGTRPTLILEVTSPETRRMDVIEKVSHYARAGVPCYVIVDSVAQAGRTELHLRGYELVGTTYAPLAPDARGWLWLDAVQVWLGIQDNEVYAYDRDGQQLGDYATVVAQLTTAVTQLVTEHTARVAAEAQAEAAEAQAAREREARMEAEAQAQAAQNQAAAAEAQAARERETRMRLEAQLQAMQEELRRLRGED